MSDGGRDAGFWVLLVIAAVTAVCAAYTLLTATGVLGHTASGAEAEGPAGISQPETAATLVGGTHPESTDHAAAVPEKTDPDAAPAGLVIAVGDSTMLGAVDALRLKIPNLALVDAQGSRQPSATIDLLRQYRADGHLGDVVIVHVGNNGPFTADEFDEMMGVLSEVRKVLVVNLTVPPEWRTRSRCPTTPCWPRGRAATKRPCWSTGTPRARGVPETSGTASTSRFGAPGPTLI